MKVSEKGGGIAAFLVERYLPVYPIYLTLWVVAVESMTVVIGDAPGPWRPTWDTAIKALALIVAGAFLRMVDDQKDLDYDRLHNPARPLVQGRITSAELRVAMVPAAVVALALAAAVSSWAAALLAVALSYGLALWWIELRVAVVRDNPIANLVMVCPAQFLVTAFAMVAVPGIGATEWWQLLAVPLVFTSAFLHLEFARKTSRAPDTNDKHSYSRAIGVTTSAVVAGGFGVVAVALELLVTMPWRWTGQVGSWWPLAWLPLAVGVLPLLSAWIFFRGDSDEHPRSWPTVFVIAFYLSIVGQGLAYH